MTDSQQNLIRLQDLKFISGETQDDEKNILGENERRNITQEFANTDRDVRAFFAKIFPQAIDVICSLNKLITRQNNILLFKNQEVQSADLAY